MHLLERMGLKLRKKESGYSHTAQDDGGGGAKEDDDRKKKSGNYGRIFLLVCGMLALVVAIVPEGFVQKATGGSNTKINSTSSKAVETNDAALKRMIGEDVQLFFLLNKVNQKETEVSLGPHEAKVVILKSDCNHPRIAMRLKGEALVFIPLQQSGSTWLATFYMPVAGAYEVDARWYGCGNNGVDANGSFASLTEPLILSASENSTEPTPTMVKSKTSLDIFPTGFWRFKKNITEQADAIKSDYVWIPMEKRNGPIQAFYQAGSSQGESTVTMEGNPVLLHTFAHLSNYEVVCWVGTETSALSRENFLSLRGQLAKIQRPFKFHYNKITDLSNPEVSMDEKRMSRKCKQTWVMMDEMEVSQEEYKKQVVNFLKGIEKCMHDDTWSIWMFTVNTNNPKACHSPSKRTQHHPCNDALFEIFDSQTMPGNVRLVDNTDMTNAQMGENPQDVSATIAMRIAALIGKQVEIWRTAGQIGKVDGLHRNGTLEDDPADECHFSPPP